MAKPKKAAAHAAGAAAHKSASAPAKSAPAAAAPAAKVSATPAPAARTKPAPDRISARAHQIWLDSGRPAGRALEHWLQAERELGA